MNVRVFLDVLVRPGEVLKAQKKDADLKKALGLHVFAAFLAVVLSYYSLLNLRLDWTMLLGAVLFVVVFLLSVFFQLLGVALMHAISKMLDGKGRFTEILWLTGLYAIQLLLIGKVIHLTLSLTGWFALLYIPLIIYGLFLDYNAVKTSHLLSTGKSMATAIAAYIGKIILMLAVGVAIYLILIVALMVGWFGGNLLMGSEVEVVEVGNQTIYHNIGEGYSFTIPEGWDAGNQTQQDMSQIIGMRAFTKEDTGMIIMWEGFFGKMMQGVEYTEEECERNATEGRNRYKDFGNVKGCEVGSGSQIMFMGKACEKTALMLQMQFLDFTPDAVNETITAYEGMMKSLTCPQEVM